MRLPEELVQQIDERAQRLGYSRNAWLEKALSRLVSMSVQTQQREEKL